MEDRKLQLMKHQESLNQLLDKGMLDESTYNHLSDIVENLSTDKALNEYVARITSADLLQQRLAQAQRLASVEQTQSQIASMQFQRMTPRFALTNLGRAVNQRTGQAF